MFDCDDVSASQVTTMPFFAILMPLITVGIGNMINYKKIIDAYKPYCGDHQARSLHNKLEPCIHANKVDKLQFKFAVECNVTRLLVLK